MEEHEAQELEWVQEKFATSEAAHGFRELLKGATRTRTDTHTRHARMRMHTRKNKRTHTHTHK